MFTDLLTAKNIIFFLIIDAIALIVFIVFLAVVREMLHFLLIIFKKIFYKKDVINEDSKTAPEVKESQKGRAEAITPQPKLGFNNYSFQAGKKEPNALDEKNDLKPEEGEQHKGMPKNPEESLDALKSKGALQENKILEPKTSPTNNVIKDPGDKREQASVVIGDLGKNQSVSAGVALSGKTLGDSIIGKKIEIPIPQKIKDAQKSAVQQRGVFWKSALGAKEKNEPMSSEATSGVIKDDVYNKIVSNKVIAKKQANKETDASIFEGKKELTRPQLRMKLKGYKAYEAQRKAGLSLSPIQRAKLEKEIFSSVLGLNISKADLKYSIKKLNKKMVSAKDPDTHRKLRKEILFFKKLGGIK